MSTQCHMKGSTISQSIYTWPTVSVIKLSSDRLLLFEVTVDFGISVTRGPRTLKISWESPNIIWKTGSPDGTS